MKAYNVTKVTRYPNAEYPRCALRYEIDIEVEKRNIFKVTYLAPYRIILLQYSPRTFGWQIWNKWNSVRSGKNGDNGEKYTGSIEAVLHHAIATFEDEFLGV